MTFRYARVMSFLCAFTIAHVLWLCPDAEAGRGPREAEVRARLCSGIKQEVTLGKMGRADCVSTTHAIEIDWSEKWHEGLGQVLAYATATRLRPGLVLVCRQDEANCLRHSLAAQEVLSAQSLTATVWNCGLDATSLSDCRRVEVGR